MSWRIFGIIMLVGTALLPDGGNYWMQMLTLSNGLAAGFLIATFFMKKQI